MGGKEKKKKIERIQRLCTSHIDYLCLGGVNVRHSSNYQWATHDAHFTLHIHHLQFMHLNYAH
jgi:hypothetical protein